jgi:hypothetical protein
LRDGQPRDLMLAGLAKVKARLRAPATGDGSGKHPADRAADIIFARGNPRASNV